VSGGGGPLSGFGYTMTGGSMGILDRVVSEGVGAGIASGRVEAIEVLVEWVLFA
jgi:hypothetical protein